jgi:hypothetical protein
MCEICKKEDGHAMCDPCIQLMIERDGKLKEEMQKKEQQDLFQLWGQ